MSLKHNTKYAGTSAFVQNVMMAFSDVICTKKRKKSIKKNAAKSIE